MFLNIPEIDALECAQWLESDAKQVQVIDVRTPQEVQAGTIPGALHLPLHMLPFHVDDVDRENPVVIICRTGARSGQACAYLAQQGYGNVFNLRGGIMDWVRRGLPTGMAGDG